MRNLLLVPGRCRVNITNEISTLKVEERSSIPFVDPLIKDNNNATEERINYRSGSTTPATLMTREESNTHRRTYENKKRNFNEVTSVVKLSLPSS